MGEAPRSSAWHGALMTAPPVPLVWAKLQPPMSPARAIVRDHLIDELTASPDVVLTAIVAPAGYGKTTTAAQLVDRLGHPTAWLGLEPADGDPVRFWTYVTAAFASAGIDELEVVYDKLRLGPSGIDDAIASLRAAIETNGEPVVLVLDDVQAIDSDLVHGQLGGLLRHPPANLQTVCTSRSDLPLPVGRLRSEGRLAEARIDRLAFSPSEVASVLDSTFGLGSLSDQHLAALVERTDGWPVGICLAGIGLRHDADVDGFVARFSGDGRHLNEYLSAEAIDDLDPDRRAFLLTTSITSTLDPDLCDALTGQPGGLAMLRSLVRDNIFTVALNEQGTHFRYHPLFQEHLRSLLAEEHPETIDELHARASRWYEDSGDVDQAITHAAASGEVERACQMIAASWHLFARAGQLSRLEQWLGLLGDAAASNSEASLMMNWVLLNSGRLDEMERWERAALDAASTNEERALCEIEIPTLRSHRARRAGDVGRALACAYEALSVADLDTEPVLGGPVSRLAALPGTALVACGVAEYWAGNLPEARRCLSAAVTHAQRTGEASSVIQGYCYLAAVEADLGDDDAALAHADQVLGLVDPAIESFHLPAMAHVARSIALLRMGRVADAGEAIEHGERLARALDCLTLAAVAIQRARIAHVLGDRAGARAAVREARSIVEELPDPRFDARLRAVENEIRFVAKAAADFGFGPVELTERERSVLTLLPFELSRAELAAQLHVSENTVKTHLTSIRRKLGLSGRASIVDRARDLGLLD